MVLFFIGKKMKIEELEDFISETPTWEEIEGEIQILSLLSGKKLGIKSGETVTLLALLGWCLKTARRKDERKMEETSLEDFGNFCQVLYKRLEGDWPREASFRDFARFLY